jgi:hypothetical protein
LIPGGVYPQDCFEKFGAAASIAISGNRRLDLPAKSDNSMPIAIPAGLGRSLMRERFITQAVMHRQVDSRKA